MGLRDLHIAPTDSTPEIILKSEGFIIIRGRGLVINKLDFYEEVTAWINRYLTAPPEITRVYISFEYLNSFCLSFIIAILKALKSVMTSDNVRLSVSWYLEEDDEDIHERGLHLSHVTDLPLKFIQVPDISQFNQTNPLFWNTSD